MGEISIVLWYYYCAIYLKQPNINESCDGQIFTKLNKLEASILSHNLKKEKTNFNIHSVLNQNKNSRAVNINAA